MCGDYTNKCLNNIINVKSLQNLIFIFSIYKKSHECHR